MVGGKVIGLAREPEGVTLLNVRDKHDECAVRCQDDGKINVGDAVWWQCGKCYWTPKANLKLVSEGRCGVDFDRPLPKIGYSH